MMKRLLAVSTIFAILFSSCGWSGSAPKPQELPKAADGVRLEGLPVAGLGREELEAAAMRLAATRQVAPVNAGFDVATGQITPETAGQAVDISATVEKVLVAAPGSELSAAYRPVNPEITADRLGRAKRLGGYTSPILDASPGRMENIRLTAKLLNNGLLPPGEEFSFNRRTGEPTAERGFRPATVFMDGRKEQELGGGMCQVSSTLYNAVLEASLPVVERHAHSLPVSYVPLGRDATTYTDKDFRFTNNTGNLLLLRALVTAKGLTVDLWSLPR